MIGFSFTIGGINHMTPWGGAQAILGNNPFSIALPAGQERPVVLDMACSMAARGKILVAAKDNSPIPDDWAIGPDGQPTTDPVEALKGFMLPKLCARLTSDRMPSARPEACSIRLQRCLDTVCD
jgi:LDH2 family malate/lactate/ureidoglycolate dehydrogenase